MDILGVGIPELIFILLIAMMVFGPRRLPEIAGQIGRYVRKFRTMSQVVQSEWQQQIQDVTSLKNQAQGSLQEASKLLPPSPKELSREIKSQVTNTISIDNPLKPKPKVSPDIKETPELDKTDVIEEKENE
ncbi:twin-arginine translocase TatA/TatE family subunit [Anaerolineales bacterium HSG6]|nr:twin-arginine translocase TatA/TatE family subunit [Anaerolineales bacterium HSG6]MDM8532641.1 twin-arginine translocase TatA/TatE family subunit [Anaerolineales bacterium HSG25]